LSAALQKGHLIGDRYEILQYLNEGGMQVVYVAQDRLIERLVALKTPKNRSAHKRFRRSAILAAKVNHPNVAKTLDYIQDDNEQYLIEELVDGNDLKAALLVRATILDPYLAAKVLHHLVKGVAAAHHAGVAHRDLKPSNIMVTGDYSLTALKITDFGIAIMADEELRQAVEGGEDTLTSSTTALGALPYMAPEAVEGKNDVGMPADIWSVGAIMYQLICGDPPFGQGLRAVPKIIAAERPELPPVLTANPQFEPLLRELFEIILSCLRKNANERPTADQLVEACRKLCYTASPRQQGTVRSFMYNSYGYIASSNGDVFFHKECVYGPAPNVGDRVLFAAYDGGGAPRALPVLKLKN